MQVTTQYINQGIKAGDTVIYKRPRAPYTCFGNHLHQPRLSSIKRIERTIVGVCNLPATKDLVAQLKPGDRVLLKPPTCPQYDGLTARTEELNKSMGLEHKIKYRNSNAIFPLYLECHEINPFTQIIPFHRKEIAKITFICKG